MNFTVERQVARGTLVQASYVGSLTRHEGVEFQQNPFCGVARDNIFARRAASSGFASSAIVDSPLDADDSVLLPCEE